MVITDVSLHEGMYHDTIIIKHHLQTSSSQIHSQILPSHFIKMYSLPYKDA